MTTPAATGATTSATSGSVSVWSRRAMSTAASDGLPVAAGAPTPRTSAWQQQPNIQNANKQHQHQPYRRNNVSQSHQQGQHQYQHSAHRPASASSTSGNRHNQNQNQNQQYRHQQRHNQFQSHSQQQHTHRPHQHPHQNHAHGPRHWKHESEPFRKYSRKWIKVQPPVIHSANKPKSSHPPLNYTMVSYNILCDAYVERGYFPHTPPWLLASHHRRQSIAEHLTRGTHPISNAHIVALQEVDSYESFWKPQMQSHGYDSLFKHRTATQAARADGSAIFWKRDSFELVSSLPIEYHIYPTADTKDNVGLAVLLRCIEPSSASSSASAPRYVAVTNTHLLFNPKRGDLKIGQMQILLNSIDAWLNQFCRQQVEQTNRVPQISIITVGDFNASTDSALMQFALEGELNLDSDRAYVSMPGGTPHGVRSNGVGGSSAGKMLWRKLMDGTETHNSRAAMKEEEDLQRQFSQQQQQHEQAQASAAASTSKKKKRRREDEGEAAVAIKEAALKNDDAEPVEDEDELMDAQGSASHSSSSSRAHSPSLDADGEAEEEVASSTPIKSNSWKLPFSAAQRGPADAITTFFPFNEHDSLRHIHHSLNLQSVFVDQAHMRLREKLQPLTATASSSSVSASPLRTDPLTGVPIRYRPTSHHARSSIQVDHVFISPLSYEFRAHDWNPLMASSPKAVLDRVMKGKNGQSELVSEATASASSSIPSLRITSILEFPPPSAFAKRAIEKLIQVKKEVQTSTTTTTSAATTAGSVSFANAQMATIATASTSSLDAAAASASAFITSLAFPQQPQQAQFGGSAQAQGTQKKFEYVMEKKTFMQSDKGLPVPDYPSDHFPLAFKFDVL